MGFCAFLTTYTTQASVTNFLCKNPPEIVNKNSEAKPYSGIMGLVMDLGAAFLGFLVSKVHCSFSTQWKVVENIRNYF
jgi:hypothetical protein